MGEKREGEDEEEKRTSVNVWYDNSHTEVNKGDVGHWILFFLVGILLCQKLALFFLLLTLGRLASTLMDGQELCSCQV